MWVYKAALASLLSFVVLSTRAQLGVSVGYNSSIYRLSDTIQSQPLKRADNLNAGIFYRFQKNILVLQPSLYYTRKGAVDMDVRYYPWVTMGGYAHDKLHYIAFSVPVIASLPLTKKEKDWRFEAGIGPYVAQLRKASAKTYSLGSGRQIKQNYKVGDSPTDAFKTWDSGLILSAGLNFKNNGVVFQYDLGLAEISSRPLQSIKNRSFSINFQFAFR